MAGRAGPISSRRELTGNGLQTCSLGGDQRCVDDFRPAPEEIRQAGSRENHQDKPDNEAADAENQRRPNAEDRRVILVRFDVVWQAKMNSASMMRPPSAGTTPMKRNS